MTLAASSDPTLTRKTAASDSVRWFYSLAGLVLLAAMFIGFQQFFLHGRAHPGREITPPIRTLVIVHGLATTLWMVIFTVQPMLILARRYKAHFALGRLGAGVAAAVLVLGTMIAVQSARVAPPEFQLWGLNAKQFMAVPLVSIWVFAALVLIAIQYRRRPTIHRAMMFTATLSISAAAISRIDPISNLYIGTAWERLFGPFFGAIVLGAALLGLRCVLTRSFDRWLAGGVGIFMATSALTMAVARTAAWDWFASMLVP